jgi:hypothetical protein
MSRQIMYLRQKYFLAEQLMHSVNPACGKTVESVFQVLHHSFGYAQDGCMPEEHEALGVALRSPVSRGGVSS